MWNITCGVVELVLIRTWMITLFLNIQVAKGSDIIISIDPGDLDEILHSKTGFPLNSTLRSLYRATTPGYFLGLVPTFLIVPNSLSDEEKITTNMKRVVASVAEYNQNNTEIETGTKIKIWISIFPYNVSGQITEIFNMIQDANSRFGGHASVTGIILHYKWLKLAPHSNLLISQDIALARNAIGHNGNTTILLGAVFHPDNCVLSELIFENLNLKSLDMALFLPYETSKNNLHFYLASLFCYRKLVDGAYFGVGPIPGNAIAWPIELDLDSNTYSIDPNLRYMLQGGGRTGIPTHNVALTYTTKFWDETRKKENNLNVLDLLASSHDSSSTSACIYTEYTTLNTTLLTQNVVHNFEKIIIEMRTAKAPTNWIKVGTLINGISSAQQIKYNNKSGGVYKNRNNSNNIHLMLKVNVDFETTPEMGSINKNILDSALGVVLTNNMEVQSGILLNFDICRKFQRCNSDNDFWRMDVVERYNIEQQISHSNLKSTIAYIRNNSDAIRSSQNATRVPVGILLDTKFCPSFTRVFQTFGSEVRETDIFIFGAVVKASNIKTNGVRNTLSELVQKLWSCTLTFLKDGYKELSQNKSKQQVALYVKVVGCSRNYTDAMELVQFVRFSEMLNKWAMEKNTTVYINSAFEDPSIIHSSEEIGCSGNVADDFKEACDCGIWRVTKSEATSSKQIYHFDDKKSIALELYEKNAKGDKGDESASLANLIVPISVTTTVVIFCIVAVASYFIFRYNNKYVLTQMEMQNFLEGQAPANRRTHIHDCAGAQMIPYNRTRYELKASNFNIDKNMRLGCGEFGLVCSGVIRRQNVEKSVAVKMTLDDISSEKSYGHYLAVKGLLSEIKILSFVGQHPNIIWLEGAYTAKLKSGKIFVFLELCENGSLEKYLRAYKPETINQGGNDELSAELSEDLYRWTGEVAKGMEHLAEKHVVHADLATRNILLTSTKCTKISDFGLSRRMYNYTEYVKKEQEPLPWRWMAPESLRRSIFNEKTDIWSFGVTLWEMYNLGDLPYPGLSWQPTFPTLLERGLRLPAPKYNENGMHEVMKRCWEIDPLYRPTFSELRSVMDTPSVNLN